MAFVDNFQVRGFEGFCDFCGDLALDGHSLCVKIVEMRKRIKNRILPILFGLILSFSVILPENAQARTGIVGQPAPEFGLTGGWIDGNGNAIDNIKLKNHRSPQTLSLGSYQRKPYAQRTPWIRIPF